MFQSATAFLADLADTLQAVGSSSLAAQWTGIAAAAQARAYNTILAALAMRGYTLAQILASDQGLDWERSLGLYLALVRGAGLANVNKQLLDSFDVREDLKVVCLTGPAGTPGAPAAGGFLTPAGTDGLPSVGRVSRDDGLFNLDPDDPRRGQVTKW